MAIIGYTVLLNDVSVAEEIVETLKSYSLDAYTADELLNGPYRTE